MDTGTSNKLPQSTDELVNRLQAQHAELDSRLRQIESHISLTSTEQVEVQQLKKLKLRTKDQLFALRHQA